MNNYHKVTKDTKQKMAAVVVSPILSIAYLAGLCALRVFVVNLFLPSEEATKRV